MSFFLNKINDICLYVDNFQESVKFYQEVFGFSLKRLQPKEENANYAEFNFKGTSLTLWEKSSVIKDTELKNYLKERKAPNFMIAIRVEKVKDVDEVYASIISRGAQSISSPRNYKFGTRACYISDNEGNIWEIFTWLDHNDGSGLIFEK